MGIRNPHNIALICEWVSVPVILDAGIGGHGPIDHFGWAAVRA